MSRLYYSQPKALAAVAAVAGAPAAAGAAAGGGAPQPPPTKGFDINDTATKVAKLVPAELITAYTALIGFAANAGSARVWCSVGAFVLCLVLTPIYLNKMADAGKPKMAHLIVSSVAFVVWAYFISGQQILGQNWYNSGIASMILLGFSLVTAVIPIG